ncbi:MAG: hypothetical protein RL329_4207, partial [Bacteroidota bacterium]
MPTQRSETEHINELYHLKGLLKIEKQ